MATKQAGTKQASTPKAKSKQVRSAKPEVSLAAPFSGFPKDCLAFLVELQVNNERDWFKANQARYEASVRDPALAFIRAMAPLLSKVSKQFVAIDKKVGGSLMRPQRDTRFAANQAPYKTNVGIQFRHTVGKDVHAPGFYFHIDPEEVFIGVGLWHPEAEALRAVRKRVVEKSNEFERAVSGKPFTSKFKIGGESLTRPPQGFDAAHPLIDVLKRKDHIAMAQLPHRAVSSPKLATEVAEHFAAASPLMRFLCQALGLAY